MWYRCTVTADDIRSHPGLRQLADDRSATAAVRREVQAHQPGDDRESDSCRQVLQALDQLERPLDRHADRTHVTGSAVVVGRRGTVLHLHKRLGMWLQPGGHLDPGETPSSAAWREAGEETGLAVSHIAGGPRLIHVDVHRAADDHLHLDLRYLLTAEDADPAPGPGESQDVAWFTWDAALEKADGSLAAALRAAVATDVVQRLRGGPGHTAAALPPPEAESPPGSLPRDQVQR